MPGFTWVGFDLDRTLAKYNGWKGDTVIGEPIAPMIALVKQYLEKGERVKVFTARVARPDTRDVVTKAIQEWCREHIGHVLEVTNEKDMGCTRIYDDIARQVVPNEGIIVGEAKAA